MFIFVDYTPFALQAQAQAQAQENRPANSPEKPQREPAQAQMSHFLI
jgi:hypothetical protein